MDLSAERKQQIEEEERQRLAEEQYRAQVRSSLHASAGPSVPPSAPSAQKPERQSRVMWLLWMLAIVAIGALVVANSNGRHLIAPSTRVVPVRQKVASGQVVVRANGYVQYRFQVTPEMRDSHISGHFRASGGSGNDIDVIIATEDEFTNWINGHQARVFYGTHGRKTTDTFDVRLEPGRYCLVFDNRFSAFSAKDVFLEVDLNSRQMEAD